MGEDLELLVDLLDLEQVEVDIFRGTQPDEERQRVFGGQVAAQALVAAGRTVEHGVVHSLHSYFLRPGDPKIPILYEVDRIRDGKSFTTRRVVAIQHGRAIFNMQTSFHRRESGFEHAFPMPHVPDPESLPTFEELVGDADAGELEMRFVGGLPWGVREPRPPYKQLWIRADGLLDDDPLLHACVATYASDMSLFDTILLPHSIDWDDGGFMGASLDHCMWFHRPFRADEWLLFDTDSPVAYGARGMARGFLYDRAGHLCVSMVQEGLARVISPRR